MMYGFTVKAWLILGAKGSMVKVPFASIQACKAAFDHIGSGDATMIRDVTMVITGATTEEE